MFFPELQNCKIRVIPCSNSSVFQTFPITFIYSEKRLNSERLSRRRILTTSLSLCFRASSRILQKYNFKSFISPRKFRVLAFKIHKEMLIFIVVYNANKSRSRESLQNDSLSKDDFKSMIRHCVGGGGGLEAITTIKAITSGWFHPTINQDVS
ncbi:unnamed protein product [Vicia faba]|uniref:Uncharacterized protein n=1 Tax=Vicia faba TaxID=3906 RepID=A0AAV1AJ89_VICFA|nr:unnamed protein product [Vicia faba]